ncbi:DinB family protein [Paenibacillus sp.]|uniref:DinB family protein n=1 Tax=Paenibacillus sp. TaxID=58172 RepID=UPI002D7510C6|nr:DinB family protein [Paenibacillus sp.]HZG58568.1 DinB family protein [Paenibacillus sp.]
MKEAFERMLRHMAWADRRIGATLGKAERSAADTEDAEQAGLPLEAAKLYAHVVGAEANWLSRLTGGDSFVAPIFPAWNVAEASARSEELLPKFETFIAACDDFERLVVYRTSTGAEFRTSVADILTHVFLHGSYHRGQINARLRGAGLEPTPVDYILFARE